jgi:hypothetical protein
VVCKVVLGLIWLLPPLLEVCALPLRPRPRPRPRPRLVYPVFRSNAEGSRQVEVSMRPVFVEPAVELAGRPRRRLTVRGSWIRSGGLVGRLVGGSSRGRSNHQCTSISVSCIFSTEVALRCSCLWRVWQHRRPYTAVHWPLQFSW